MPVPYKQQWLALSNDIDMLAHSNYSVNRLTLEKFHNYYFKFTYPLVKFSTFLLHI